MLLTNTVRASTSYAMVYLTDRWFTRKTGDTNNIAFRNLMWHKSISIFERL